MHTERLTLKQSRRFVSPASTYYSDGAPTAVSEAASRDGAAAVAVTEETACIVCLFRPKVGSFVVVAGCWMLVVC